MRTTLKEGKFGVNEGVSLVITGIITKLFYSSASMLVNSMGTAAWYGTIVSCLTTLVFFLLTCLLLKRFPGKDLTEIFVETFGGVFGRLASLLYSAFIVYYVAMNLREFTDIIKTYIFPFTPVSVILVSFLIVASLLVSLGLEVIARVSLVYLYFILGGFVLLLALTSSDYNPDLIKPYLGYGLGNTLRVSFFRSSAYSEVLAVAFFAKSLQGYQNVKKAGITGLLISGGLASVVTLLYLMAFGYVEGREPLSGLFQLSRIIYLSRFIQRVEPVFIFVWVVSSVITVSIAFYVSLSIYCKVFNISNHRPLIFLFSYLMLAVSILPKNISEVLDIHMIVVRQYSFVLSYGLIIVALIVSLVFKRKGGKA